MEAFTITLIACVISVVAGMFVMWVAMKDPPDPSDFRPRLDGSGYQPTSARHTSMHPTIQHPPPPPPPKTSSAVDKPEKVLTLEYWDANRKRHRPVIFMRLDKDVSIEDYEQIVLAMNEISLGDLKIVVLHSDVTVLTSGGWA